MAKPVKNKELARGREIELRDGSTVRIFFSMYALAVLEEEYGSIPAIDKVLKSGGDGQLLKTLGILLAASVDDDEREFTPKQILKQIPIERMGETMVAVEEAMAEGFQKPQRTTKPALPNLPRTTASPGARSSTSGASRSAKAGRSSGA